MNSVDSGSDLLFNSIIGNTANSISFYKTHNGIGLYITLNGSYVAVANDSSTFIYSIRKFPSSKSNCTILNKWHVISVTWSNGKDLSNCWSNGEKLMTFTTLYVKGSDHCIISDLGTSFGKTYLTGSIGEIIGFYRSLMDEESSHIHQYLMNKWT